jgi:hypothetical protein
MLAARQSHPVGKKINGHDEGGRQYPEQHGMTRLIDESAVCDKHANKQHAGSNEDDIEQIIRDHAPHYSDAGTKITLAQAYSSSIILLGRSV